MIKKFHPRLFLDSLAISFIHELHEASKSSILTMRILSFLLAASICSADIADHRYKQGEHVELWVNKVKT